MTTTIGDDDMARAFNAFMDNDSSDEADESVRADHPHAAVLDQTILPAPVLSSMPSTMQAALEAITEAELAGISEESMPNEGSNRRKNSLTLSVLAKACCGDIYDPTMSDVTNMTNAILECDIDVALGLSDLALANLLRVMNAASSHRTFAAASRVSALRCAVRTRCTTDEHKQAFKRFSRIVRRSDLQMDEAKAESLARSIKRQDNNVALNKRDFYKTVAKWFGSGNAELAVLAVMASTGLRFSEVISSKYEIWSFSDYQLFCPDWSQLDNIPPSLVQAATENPDRYIVNVGQAKKRGKPPLACIRPIVADITATQLVTFRTRLVGRQVHNRSANRRLRMSGASLLRDFKASNQKLTTHALRGAYVAVCTADYKPAGCGVVRFHNGILGYSKDASTAPRYQVCECI